MDHNAIG